MRYSTVRPNKLTPERVTLMRALRIYNSEVFSYEKLSRMFHVARSMAWKVTTNQNWRLVPFPDDDEAEVIAMAYLYDRH